ncbi:hypothetical protein F5B21DRAFT_247437 [Xylaria acuta]|nr:hypothetical protein F5B21DRAFT_247437 [Xylaria acuta]
MDELGARRRCRDRSIDLDRFFWFFFTLLTYLLTYSHTQPQTNGQIDRQTDREFTYLLICFSYAYLPAWHSWLLATNSIISAWINGSK